MANPTSSTTNVHAPSSPLVSILEKYLADIQAGLSPDRQKLLADHPQLAEELQAYLAGIDFIHNASKEENDSEVLGDFRIVREIGRGGMGVVYEAEQISLKRRVALKVLRFGGATDDEALQRFQREAEMIAALHHTNIVPLYSSGCSGGVHYFAMQLIEGASLAAKLKDAQNKAAAESTRAVSPLSTSCPFDPKEVAGWGLQAAEALEYAHQRGVIHRDVKPSNLLLDRKGIVWLSDFGLARRRDEVSLTATGARLGTPRYMSPEQVRGDVKGIDHRTDIFSLGAALYELTAGQPAFSGDSPQAVMAEILNDNPVSLQKRQPNVPRDLDTIVHKCLAKESHLRYQSAGALEADLRAFLDGRPIKARRTSWREKTVRWFRQRKHGVRLSGAGLITAGLLLMLCYFLWQWYADWSPGRLHLYSKQNGLRAIILDESGQNEIQRVLVPTANPVELPAGNYQIRVEAIGKLSETMKVRVLHDASQSIGVSLSDSNHLGPFFSNDVIDIPLAEVGKRHYNVWLLQKGVLRCVHGATGKVVWDTKLDIENHPHLLHAAHFDWQQIFQSNELIRAGVVSDFDGDGFNDQVYASRTAASVLSISGRTGNIQWWHIVRVPSPQSIAAAVGTGWLYGNAPIMSGAAILESPTNVRALPPVVHDIDGDGLYDVIAVFTMQRGWQTSGVLMGISGKTGRLLWQRTLRRPPTTLTRTMVENQPTVVMTTGSSVRFINPKTGAFQQKQITTKSQLNAPPKFVHTRHGQTILLVNSGNVASQSTITPWSNEDLVAYSYANGKKQWQKTMPAGNRFPIVADLDKDGQDEIIVPHGSASQKKPTEEFWNGVEIWNADGRLRWQRRLWLLHRFHYRPIQNALPGPDLNGDGHREIFVASIGRIYKPGAYDYVMIEALSGKNGKSLWRWQRRYLKISKIANSTPFGTLFWSKVGPDGRPLLLAQIIDSDGRQIIGVFETSSGRLLQSVVGGELIYGSQSNDDYVDFGYTWSDENGHIKYGFGLVATQNQWRHPGEWSVIDDVNGDRVKDLVQHSFMPMVCSGRDGRILWQTALPNVRPVHRFYCQGARDLDGDGIADVVALGPTNDLKWPCRMHALSGKTGRLLWISPAFHRSDIKSSIVLERVQLLVNAKQTDIVVAYRLPSGVGTTRHMCRIAGHDGSIRWRQSIGVFRSTTRIRTMLSADLTGNGKNASVLLYDSPGAKSFGYYIQAVSHENGRVLWKHFRPVQLTFNNALPLLRLYDTDDDGSAEILIGDGANQRVEVLNGHDGTTRWIWNDDRGNSGLGPLVLKGRSDIWICCFPEAPRLVKLDSRGKPTHQFVFQPIGDKDVRFQSRNLLFRDVDDDSIPDLVVVGDKRVYAYSFQKRDYLWSQKLRYALPISYQSTLKSGEGWSIVIKMDRRYYGLDQATGITRWTCRSDNEWRGLLSLRKKSAPILLFNQDRYDGVLCVRGEHYDETGKLIPAATERRHYDDLSPDPRLSHPLPDTHAEMLSFFALSMTLCLAVFAIPVVLFWLAMRHRSWQLLVLTSIYLAIVFVAWNSGWISDAVPWSQHFAYRSVAVAYSNTIMPFAFDLDKRVFRIVVGLPCVVFLMLAIRWAWLPRWRMLLILISLSFVLAGVRIGVQTFFDTLRFREPEEFYDWSNWYLYWFHGAHDTGVLMLVGFVLLASFHWIRRRFTGVVPGETA